MAKPRGELTLEALRSIAQSAGLTIEEEHLQQLLVQMRSMLQQLYEVDVDEETLRQVEPFHILPISKEG